MEDYLTSPETSLTLERLGVDQTQAHFYWVETAKAHKLYYRKNKPIPNDGVAAYNATEVAHLLLGFGDWITYTEQGKPIVRLMVRDGGMIDVTEGANEADARGIALAGLIKQGIINIKPAEVIDDATN